MGTCQKSHSDGEAVPVVTPSGLVRLAVILALTVASPSTALAIDTNRAITQAFLRKWQVQQGLPQPTVTVIRQTSDGALWLGTQSGLYQFDGISFDSAHIVGDASLDGVWISDLVEDQDGALWIATHDAGLLRLKDDELTKVDFEKVFEKSPSSKAFRILNCLCRARDGRIWVGADGAVGVLENGQPSMYDVSNGLSVHSILAIAEDHAGAIWIGGDEGGLCQFVDGQFQKRLDFQGDVVHALLADDKSMWVGSTRGVVRLGPDGETRWTTDRGLLDNEIECLLRSSDGTIWVGTRNGLARIVGQDVESFGIHDGLTQSTVLSLAEDREGSLWVGTKHGLNQFADRLTLPLTSTEGLPGNDIGAITQDDSGRMWIGTLKEGLAFYNGRRCEPALSTANGLPSNRIVSLAPGSEGELWVGTDRGLVQVRDNRVAAVFSTTQGLPSSEILSIARDGNGVLWVGTARGLARFDGGQFVPVSSTQLGGEPVVTLLPSRSGDIFAATVNGLFRVSGPTVTAAPESGATPRGVSTMLEGPDGEIWMAKRGRGLAVLKDGQLKRISIADGLYDEDIVGIVRDDQDRLWMGCSRGFFWIARNELLNFVPGRKEKLKCNFLSPTDGLRTVECQRDVQPAVWKATDSTMWFATIHGVVAINPKKMNRDFPKAPVAITEVSVNGRPVPTHRSIVLPPGVANISLHYAAYSYIAPTRTQYRYRLVGFDPEWVEAESRREAIYTNLPPGTYRFEVSAFMPFATGTPSTQEMLLTLTPHFWQTQWFPAACLAALIVGVWTILRLRDLRLRSQMNAVVAERSRIARELHDTLIQGFSGVTMQMQAVLARLPSSEDKLALNDVIADAGTCLREARQSVAGLRNSQGSSMGLPTAIATSAKQLTETKPVRLQLNLPERTLPMPVEVEFNLLRIAQEAVANAARHSNARTIDITLAQNNGRLALRVHDDGVGFSVADKEQLEHSHYGLIGMRERARQIAADLTIDSRPGSGTTISVDLPLARMQPGKTTLSTEQVS